MKDEKEITELKTELATLKERYSKLLKEEHELQSTHAIFLRNLSQNIRIPMNGVLGMLDVLNMTKLNNDQADYTALISNYSENLLSIINDILDHSKLMNESLKLEPDYFAISQLEKEIKELLRYKIEGKGIQLEFEISQDIPAYLYGDKKRIKQILINLLNNAIKHTREGIVKLKISKINELPDRAVLRFHVSDTGLGIDRSLFRTLKKELNSPELTTKLSLNGVGMGLSITQSLLKLMNSYLKFESEEEKGSEFWFNLTIPTRHKSRSGIYNETVIGKRGRSILLVEDNLLNQKFAKITLSKEGHLLEIAENGKVAVEKFKQNPYDLILMDIQMPIMSGIEATKEIRQIEAKQNLKPIKIIAVTAFSLDDKRKECMEAGMDNFLSKPFKPNQLIKIVEAVKFD